MKRLLIIILLLCLPSISFAQQRVDFGKAGLAPVEIIRNGKAIPKGVGATTDVARGTALQQAVAQAQAGDIIKFGPGDFDLDTAQLDLPNDVSLIGAGTQSTWIISGRDAATNGATIVPGDNSEIAYFSGNTTEHRSGKLIGSVDTASANDKDFLNAYVHHIHFESQIDGFHIVNGPGATDGAIFDFRVENCTSDGAWDFVAISVIAENATATGLLRNNKAVSDGDLFQAEANSRCLAISETGSAASITVKVYGDEYTVRDATTNNQGVYSSGNGSIIELHDITINSSGTGALDLFTESSGTLRVSGGKGSGTNGAFTSSGTISRFSAGETLARLLAVDGSGSGVDADTLRATTPTAFGLSLLDDSAASDGRTTLGLAIGSNVQAFDADLTTYAGITPSANVQSLLGAASYSAMRTQLGLTGYSQLVQFGGSSQPTVADATTFTYGVGGISASNLVGTRRIYFPMAGTITRADVYCRVGGTLGSNEQSTISIRHNNTTDYAISTTFTQDNADTVVTNSSMSIAIAAGDFIEIKWLSPTWATNPTTVTLMGTVKFDVTW
jgi:hypothetical protein